MPATTMTRARRAEQESEVTTLRDETPVEPGMTLIGMHRGQAHLCAVVWVEDQLRFVTVPDGAVFTSLSAAARHATGQQVNGRLFWRPLQRFVSEYQEVALERAQRAS